MRAMAKAIRIEGNKESEDSMAMAMVTRVAGEQRQQ
jgi:hypothetical protein